MMCRYINEYNKTTTNLYLSSFDQESTILINIVLVSLTKNIKLVIVWFSMENNFNLVSHSNTSGSCNTVSKNSLNMEIWRAELL